MQVIRATLMWLGLIVAVFPSGRISFSSGFKVTNSASIATRSPFFGISSEVSGLNVRSYCLFLQICWLIISCEWEKKLRYFNCFSLLNIEKEKNFIAWKNDFGLSKISFFSLNFSTFSQRNTVTTTQLLNSWNIFVFPNNSHEWMDCLTLVRWWYLSRYER